MRYQVCAHCARSECGSRCICTIVRSAEKNKNLLIVHTGSGNMAVSQMQQTALLTSTFDTMLLSLRVTLLPYIHSTHCCTQPIGLRTPVVEAGATPSWMSWCMTTHGQYEYRLGHEYHHAACSIGGSSAHRVPQPAMQLLQPGA